VWAGGEDCGLLTRGEARRLQKLFRAVLVGRDEGGQEGKDKDGEEHGTGGVIKRRGSAD
jgi:hypothetical protein